MISSKAMKGHFSWQLSGSHSFWPSSWLWSGFMTASTAGLFSWLFYHQALLCSSLSVTESLFGGSMRTSDPPCLTFQFLQSHQSAFLLGQPAPRPVLLGPKILSPGFYPPIKSTLGLGNCYITNVCEIIGLENTNKWYPVLRENVHWRLKGS